MFVSEKFLGMYNFDTIVYKTFILSMYLLTWADSKMSNQYLLFLFLCYEKPKLVSEKFEAIFVKQFLP